MSSWKDLIQQDVENGFNEEELLAPNGVYEMEVTYVKNAPTKNGDRNMISIGLKYTEHTEYDSVFARILETNESDSSFLKKINRKLMTNFLKSFSIDINDWEFEDEEGIKSIIGETGQVKIKQGKDMNKNPINEVEDFVQ